MSEEIEDALAGVPVTSLMGPNIYSEMVHQDDFAEATVGYSGAGCSDARAALAAAKRVQRIFTTPTFHATLSDDRTGVELCGGLKNVVSLAAGFCEGLGLGSNAKAAAVRAGLLEMVRLPRALGLAGAREDTFLREACGIGDLILTCTVGRGRRLAARFVESVRRDGPCASEQGSAERWASLESELFNGMKLPDWGNALSVHRALASSTTAGPDDFPLFSAVYSIGFMGADPRTIVDAMRRPPVEARPSARHGGLRANVDLVGRRALVTGAANGIGRAIAERLAACGADVTALDRDEGALAELGLATGCRTLAADLLDLDDLSRKVQARIAEEGVFDCLVNNAGVAKFEPFFSTSKEAFDLQYNVNVRAVAMLSMVVAQALKEAKKPGGIVHISSQSSTLPLDDHLVYSSSKAAVDHMARIQAFELGKFGIRVNTVRPTVVMTDLALKAWDPTRLEAMKQQIPLQRLAAPDDVAKVVAWLLSDDSSLVTGVALPVDGGRSMGGFGL